MTRPDLPTGCDGWQMVDATPLWRIPLQSERIGPCSLKAIKEGKSLSYNTNFVIAEVFFLLQDVVAMSVSCNTDISE